MLTAVAVPDACRAVQLHIKNIESVPCRRRYERRLHLIKIGTKFQIRATAITQPRQTFRKIKCHQQLERYIHSAFYLHVMFYSFSQSLT